VHVTGDLVGGRRRRLLASLALLGTGAVLVSACGSSGSSSGSGSSDGSSTPVSVTIAQASPVPDHEVPTVTEDAGIFKKYGINAKITLLTSGSEQMGALVSGQIQMLSIPAPVPQLSAIDDGQPMEEVAQFEDSFDAMLVSQAKYPTIASLNGATIAISTPGDFASLLCSYIEKQYGIKLKEVPIGPYPAQLAAFEAGRVDAIPALQPVQLSTVQQKVKGMHMLVDFRKVKNVPAIEIVGYGPWLKAHKATAIKMLEALNAGFKYYKDPANEAFVVKVIEKETGDSAALAEASYKSVLQNMTSTIVPSATDMKNMLSALTVESAKAGTFDASKLVDASYAEAAVKQ
jgi:ABC-type nitrate/sulfonate/bicarbonate transport system substrate-binding protein